MTQNRDAYACKRTSVEMYMFRAVFLSETAHSYAFHLAMKNNVKHSHEGGPKAKTKNSACERQPIAFFVY